MDRLIKTMNEITMNVLQNNITILNFSILQFAVEIYQNYWFLFNFMFIFRFTAMTVCSMINIDTIKIENGRLVIDPGDRTKQLQIFLEHTQIILLIAKNVKSSQFLYPTSRCHFSLSCYICTSTTYHNVTENIFREIFSEESSINRQRNHLAVCW